MKIAIDLTAIPFELTGVGYYVESLLKNLARADRRNNYYIFIKSDNKARLRVEQENFKYLVIPTYNKFIRLLWEQFVLPFYLWWIKADLLHSPHYTTPLLACWIKRVVTFPDLTFFLFPEKHEKYKVIFFCWMMKRSALIADRILSISYSTTRDLAARLPIDPNKITTTQLAAPEYYRLVHDDQLIRGELNQKKLPHKYILFVGTIEPRKNLMGLVKAYQALPRSIRDEYKLVIAGKKGWYYDELFSFISQNEGKENIYFTGYLEERSLPLIYNGAAVFVYPSFYEGFGLPVLEALSSGVPVITSNLSSMPEIAQEAAILIDPHDVSAISSAIQALLTDQGKMARAKTKGIEQARKFSWERCAKETLAVYEQIAAHEK